MPLFAKLGALFFEISRRGADFAEIYLLLGENLCELCASA
jgi:hypothetical protein